MNMYQNSFNFLYLPKNCIKKNRINYTLFFRKHSSEVNFKNNHKTQDWTLDEQGSIPFLEEMLKIKAHIGTKNWTKEMSPFLLGFRNDISIFHLEDTFICLRRVLKFLENSNFGADSVLQDFVHTREGYSRKKNNHILFVNTFRKYSEIIQQAAYKSNQSYINDRWIGGLLTNWKQISESILLYKKFNKKFDKFLLENNIQIPLYQKAKRRYNGLNSDFLISSITLPDIIILTNPDQNKNVIQEAKLFKIPVIAFADSNTNIQGIDYIIPGNSKSIYFMHFCLNLITVILQKNKMN